MQVLVIYGSRLGATRGIAERIATRLREDRLEVTVQPASGAADFTDADALVIGSGVYGGHWVKEAAEYVRKPPRRTRPSPGLALQQRPGG